MTPDLAGSPKTPAKVRETWKGLALRASLIFLAAMFVYIPAMQSKWIWDDNLLITQYVVMQHPQGLRIFWFPWTDKELGETVPDYYPITWSTLWLEWRLWGNYPQAYHVSNCIMHAIGAVLLWRVLKKLPIPGAFLAGLIFAVHPVSVCSVAWVSERKNTLSLIFFLLTLLFYLDYDRTRRWRSYALALFMLLLAMLSKASVVTLPVVMLLASWWRRERGHVAKPDFLDPVVGTWRVEGDGQLRVMRAAGRWRYILADVIRTAPFFVLALACSALVIYFQRHRVIRGEEIYYPGEGTIWWRLAMAGAVPWFYLYKALLPLNLLMIYPRWDIHANVITMSPNWQFHPAALVWLLPGVALVAVAVALLCLHRRAWARHLIFAGGYFLVLLLPTMGFFDMYFFVHSLVADHWQYLSIIGVIALVVGAGAWAFQHGPRTVRWAGVATGTVLVGVLAVLTWNQTLVYEDQIALWHYNLPQNPKAWMGQYNLGTTLAESVMNEPDPNVRREVLTEALEHLLKATELRPTDDAAQNNAGLTLMNLDRVDEAIPYLHRAVDLSRMGGNPQAAMNLSLAYRGKGNLPEALKWGEYAQRVHAHPGPDLFITYAETLSMAGRREEAIQKLNQALQVAPSYVETWYRRGMAFKAMGQTDQALADFQHVLSLQSNAAPAMVQIALIAQERGRRDEAISLCGQAVLTAPGNLEARYRLGLMLLQAGKSRDAATHLSLVVQASPLFLEARGNLALALLRSGQIDRALVEYRAALEQRPDWVEVMCDLARILAHPSSGRERNVPHAIELAEKACQLSQYEQPMPLESLAMVYSEAGRFDDATKLQQKVLQLVTPRADQETLSIVRRRLDLYKSRRPFSAAEPLP